MQKLFKLVLSFFFETQLVLSLAYKDYEFRFKISSLKEKLKSVLNRKEKLSLKSLRTLYQWCKIRQQQTCPLPQKKTRFRCDNTLNSPIDAKFD